MPLTFPRPYRSDIDKDLVISSGFTLSTTTCVSHCETKTSCGQCSLDPNCGWCDATSSCHSSALQDSGCPAGLNTGDSCCSSCTARSNCSDCAAAPGCAWDHEDGMCVSARVVNSNAASRLLRRNVSRGCGQQQFLIGGRCVVQCARHMHLVHGTV